MTTELLLLSYIALGGLFALISAIALFGWD